MLALPLIAGDVVAGDLDKLSFLKGCWAGPGTFEMWMKPEAGSIMGIGRTIRNGKVVNAEFFSIVESADGITLNVQLRLGGAVTPFRAKEVTPSSAVFENPEHDFPQRIIYRTAANGGLLGRIEGTSKGKARAFDYPAFDYPAFDYPMTRAKCD